MKNTFKKRGFELLVISFLFTLLIFSEETMALASKGLLIWYQKMIPSLFPFMVLSGFLVKSGLANRFSGLLRPVLGLLFPSSGSMLYAIFMGFLCGFPMGAKVVADLLENGQINGKQGQYLLAFCNNIGPLYMLGYVLPLFKVENMTLMLLIMYGVPLIYGSVLQHLPCYKKNLSFRKEALYPLPGGKHSSAIRCSGKQYPPSSPNYLTSFREALENALTQITLLGGCMVFFNCLQIYPGMMRWIFPLELQEFYQQYLYAPLCCLMEIGGGLKIMAEQAGNNMHPDRLAITSSLFLSFVTFGGLSCIMQTLFILKSTGLSVGNYLKHKLLQTLLVLMLSFLCC